MTPIEVFKLAKLEPRHVAHLVGVGRVTASRWLREEAEPHTLVAEKVEQVARLVYKAFREGKLPFPPGVKKSDERQYLDRVAT